MNAECQSLFIGYLDTSYQINALDLFPDQDVNGFSPGKAEASKSVPSSTPPISNAHTAAEFMANLNMLADAATSKVSSAIEEGCQLT